MTVYENDLWCGEFLAEFLVAINILQLNVIISFALSNVLAGENQRGFAK